MMQSENSLVGTLTGTKCHLQTYSKKCWQQIYIRPTTRYKRNFNVENWCDNT